MADKAVKIDRCYSVRCMKVHGETQQVRGLSILNVVGRCSSLVLWLLRGVIIALVMSEATFFVHWACRARWGSGKALMSIVRMAIARRCMGDTNNVG